MQYTLYIHATSAFVIQSTSTPTSAAKPTPTSTYTIPRALAKMSSTISKSQTIQDPQVALVTGPGQGRRCLDLGPAGNYFALKLSQSHQSVAIAAGRHVAGKVTRRDFCLDLTHLTCGGLPRILALQLV